MSAIKARVNKHVDRAEVVRLREEGLKMTQIAEICGCTQGYVSRVLREEKEKQKTA
jgi:predicted transcriptional regulator